MLKGKEYIYAVYQEGSFSKAAAKLFISQPALSAAIKRTEKNLGVKIFDRSTTPVSLTTMGEYYITEIEAVLEIERRIAAKFHLNQKNSHSIRVGSSAFFSTYVLPNLVEDIQNEYSQFTIDMIEADVMNLRRGLLDNSLDIVVEVEDFQVDGYTQRVVGQEHLLLTVPKEYAVNEQLLQYRMTFDEVRNGAYMDENSPRVNMSFFRDIPYVFLRQGNDSHQRGLMMCEESGFSPNIVLYVDQLLTSYHIASSGRGAAFIRGLIADYVEPTDKLFFYKIDSEYAIRNIRLTYREKWNHYGHISYIKDALTKRFLK